MRPLPSSSSPPARRRTALTVSLVITAALGTLAYVHLADSAPPPPFPGDAEFHGTAWNWRVETSSNGRAFLREKLDKWHGWSSMDDGFGGMRDAKAWDDSEALRAQPGRRDPGVAGESARHAGIHPARERRV